jgi:hypothetical protein
MEMKVGLREATVTQNKVILFISFSFLLHCDTSYLELGPMNLFIWLS